MMLGCFVQGGFWWTSFPGTTNWIFSWASPDHSNVGCTQWKMLKLSFIDVNSINLNLEAGVAVADWLFTVHLCQRPLQFKPV